MLRIITTASLLTLLLACNAASTDASDDSNPGDQDSGTPPSDDDGGTSPGDDGDSTTLAPKPLPSATATAVSSGTSHACALTSAGEVRCWGNCDKGQLGAGIPYTARDSIVPVQVTGLASGVTSISAGQDFTCAVLAGGNVKCWGLDDTAQLGSGKVYTDSSMQASNVPVDVVGVTGATFVAVGFDSACAIVNGGAIKCWGHDESGKLGNNSPKEGGDSLPTTSTAVDVVGITNAVHVAVGNRHACAVLADGGLKCWGANDSGQLGTGDEGFGKPTPQAVTTGALRVTAAYNQTCAVFTSGALQCWGNGDDGLLGDGQTGTIRDVLTPENVLGGESGGTDISVSSYSCGILGGAVKCWGKGAQLGTNDPDGFQTYAPQNAAIGLESGASRVSVGTSFACALTAAGAVKCWGENGVGQAGNGTGGVDGTELAEQPTAVLSLP